MNDITPRRWRRWAGAACVAALLGTPAAAHAAALPIAPTTNAPASAGELTLTDSSEALAPGMTLRHLKALTPDQGWVDLREIIVDLTQPNIVPDIAVNATVPAKSVPTTFTRNIGATAFVNGDFFDINGTGAGEGLELKDHELLKGTVARHSYLTFADDGLARVEDLAVDAKVTLGSDPTPHDVVTFNDPGNVGAAAGNGLPADSIIAYTPAWGAGSRAAAPTTPASTVEVLVTDGKVVSVTPGAAGSGAIPDRSFYLEGRGTEATALGALQIGDPVTFTHTVSDALNTTLRSALGGRQLLVHNGIPDVEANLGTDGDAPRTAVGVRDDGRTMMIVLADGRQTAVVGPTRESMADIMASLGSDEAVNFDGGASSAMVAHHLGDSTGSIINTIAIAGGGQRSVPNGIGLWVTPGDGLAHKLVVTPDATSGSDDVAAARVFPGLHRTFDYKAIDDHGVAVAPPADGLWAASRGTFDGASYQAPADAAGSDVTVTATAGGATGGGTVRVLGAPTRLTASRTSVAFGAIGETQDVTVSGVDGEGYGAPIDAGDLRLDYDHDRVDVRPSADGSALSISPLVTGAEFVTASIGDASVSIQVQTGTSDTLLSDFTNQAAWIRGPTHNETQAISWVPQGGHDGVGDALQLDYDFTGLFTDPAWQHSAGIKPAATSTYPMPAGTTSFSFWIRSSGTTADLAITWAGASGSATSMDGIARLSTTEWQQVNVTVPSTMPPPIHISSIQPIDTDKTRFYNGTIWFSDLRYHTAVTATPPPPPAPVPDRLVSADGRLPGDSGSWRFGAIGDTRIDDASSSTAQRATLEVQRAVQQKPDFLLLDGDVESAATAGAMTNARTALEHAGCTLVPLDQTPPADAPSDGTVPCLYLPGDLEWGTDGAAFTSEFGRGYGTFDHKGVRFILLDSGKGGIAGTAFAQFPMFADALASARDDPSIHNVVVVAHHTLDDPAQFGTSQLRDTDDAALVSTMLSRFRQDSGKGITMIGAHAQVADVRRGDGVPYVTLPSAGPAPGGTVSTGGFDGWVRFGVDPARAGDDNWLDADVRAYSDETTLAAPASVGIGHEVAVSGGLEQSPTKTVPIGYPASTAWTGSDSLAIGSGQAAIDAAEQAGKVAIVDPATGIVRGLHIGEVTVGIENDSLIAGPPTISAQRTIAVTASDLGKPALSTTAVGFADEAAGTVGPAQTVTISSLGEGPLRIGSVSVADSDGVSSRDFQVDGSACTAAVVEIGANCAVTVRFTPQRADATSNAQLVIDDNTPAGRHTVALTAHSKPVPPVDTPPGGGNDTPIRTDVPPVTPPVTPPGHTAATPTVATKVAAKLKAARGAVAVTLSTPSGTTATGTVQLKATIAVPRPHGKKGSVRRVVILGSARFSLANGGHRTLQLTLNKAGRAALAKAHTLRVTVVIGTRDAAGHVHNASHALVLHANTKKHVGTKKH